MCIGLICIACVIASGNVGSMSMKARTVLTVICVTVSLYAFFRLVIRRKMHAIHISGIGQIRLSVFQKNDLVDIDNSLTGGGEAVHLLPVSTLWSGLLLLHLQNEQRQTTVVTILPDSVSKENFRALLVACRWIVMRHANAEAHRDDHI